MGHKQGAALDLSPIVLAHEDPFALGNAEVRPATRELRSDNRSVILEPRVMQLLVALHRADGAVVNKDDLIQLCWSGRVVGEDAINRVVSRLRQDLAKVFGADLLVETITKVGYRLRNREPEEQDFSARIAATAIDRRQVLWAGGVALGAAALGTLAWNGSQADNLPREAAGLLERTFLILRS